MVNIVPVIAMSAVTIANNARLMANIRRHPKKNIKEYLRKPMFF